MLHPPHSMYSTKKNFSTKKLPSEMSGVCLLEAKSMENHKLNVLKIALNSVQQNFFFSL